MGLPMALGASIACPDRQVLALQADGSAMYTLQALWTMARESLDVTTVIVQQRQLRGAEHGAQPGRRVGGRTESTEMLDLHGPDLDFVQLAGGMGVDAERVDTAEGLTAALERCLAEPGPHVIDAVLPPLGL